MCLVLEEKLSRSFTKVYQILLTFEADPVVEVFKSPKSFALI